LSIPRSNPTKEHVISWNNESHNLYQWSKITGIAVTTLLYRLEHNFTVEKIFAKPKKRKAPTFKNHRVTWRGETKLVSEWSKELGINYVTLICRFKAKWPIDRIFSTKHAYKEQL
jgi:hypothetical protein